MYTFPSNDIDHGLDAVIEKIQSVSLNNHACRNPVDITPTTNKRLALLRDVFEASPVLLLVGSHLSLARNTDPITYLVMCGWCVCACVVLKLLMFGCFCYVTIGLVGYQ